VRTGCGLAGRGMARLGLAWQGEARHGRGEVSKEAGMVKTQTIKAAFLIEDFELYPRLRVDDLHVARLAEALLAGQELPPIVADRATLRIVDGFHRRRAYIKAFGPDAEVPVLLKEYPDEKAILLDAIRHNAGHGKRFTAADEVRALLLAERVGLEPAVVANALAIRVEKLTELASQRVAVSGAEKVVLKPALRHLAGTRLTPEQELANRHLNGNQASFYARSLIELLESGGIDWGNRVLVERLLKLYQLLGELLPLHVEPQEPREAGQAANA